MSGSGLSCQFAHFCLILLAGSLVASGSALAGPTRLNASDFEPVWQDPAIRSAVVALDRGEAALARDALAAARETVPGAEQDRFRFLLGHVCHEVRDWGCVLEHLDGLETRLPLLADRIVFERAWARAESGQRSGILAAFFSSWDRGDLERALSELSTIPSGSPVERAARTRSAEILERMERWSDAVEAWRTRMALRKDSEAVTGLAGALVRDGQTAEAVRLLREAFFGSAGSGRAAYQRQLTGLGEVLDPTTDERLRHAEALLDAFDSLEVLDEVKPLTHSADPKVRCRALYLQAGALTRLRRHREALASYREQIGDCSAHADMSRVLFSAARAAYRSGSAAEGDEIAARLRRERPDATFNDDLLVSQARTAIGAGKRVVAKQKLEESLRVYPRGDMAKEARWLLVWDAFKARNDAEVVRLAKAGEAATRDDPDFASRFCYWHARALDRAGQSKEALARWSACVRDYPMMFYGFMALNRLKDARRTSPGRILRELTIGSSHPPFLTLSRADVLDSGPVARARWLAQTGLPGLAADELSKVDERDPDAGWVAAMLLDAGSHHRRSHRMAKNLLRRQGAGWPTDDTAGYFRLAYPRPHAEAVAMASRESGVSSHLIYGVMREESAFVAGIESHANAMGLMQLILPTAKAMGRKLGLEATPETLRRPEVNIRLGASFLSDLLKRFKEPLLAIPGYNAGGGAIGRWLKENPGALLDEFVEGIGATETRDYARKVFESYAAYTFLYGAPPYVPVELPKDMKIAAGGKTSK